MVLAWENLRRFLWCWSSFCCCCYSSFVDVFHSHFLFDIIPHPSVDYRQVFRPILYFQPSPSQSDLRHFHFQPFRYLLTASATVLSGHFLPTGVFYLMLLPDIFDTFPTFWHNLLLSRFHWIHINPQSFIHLKSVFMQVNIAKVLLVMKTLIRSAATLFHENIKQQPN